MRIMPHCATRRKRQKREYRNQPICDTIETRREVEALLPFWAPVELSNCQSEVNGLCSSNKGTSLTNLMATLRELSRLTPRIKSQVSYDSGS